MSVDALPRRSQDGLSALDIFYDDFNDVHFFVEDEDQENLYEVVLGRMFPELTIARIFPLGGKQAVLDHSSQACSRDEAPRSVYLVDKDFDDILGTIVQRPMLFYLERYCIENYFIEADAIVEIVVESQPKLKRIEIADSLDIANKLSELTESIRPLFQLFYCVQRFELGIKNGALPAERFCSEKRRWVLDLDALEKYKADVVLAASRADPPVGLVDPLTHPEIAPLSTMESHAVISGKHLCTLIFHYLKSKYKLGSITFESFLFRLAKNASMHELLSLATRIRESLQSPPVPQ